MIQPRIVPQLLLMTLICVCAWAGVVLQFLTLSHTLLSQGKTWLQCLVQFFSFFTITTNTLVAITTTIALCAAQTKWGIACKKPAAITAIAVYIVVVGLVYNILLRPTNKLQGIDSFGNELVHSVVPLLYTIYWLAFATKGSVTWRSWLRWLLYPFVYLVYTFVHGMITNWYPYPFVNVNEIGYRGFWLNCLYLLLLFILLNLLFISIDKWLAKRIAPLYNEKNL